MKLPQRHTRVVKLFSLSLSRYIKEFGLLPLTSGFSNDYRDDFDPRITNEFSSAAFRVGHTMIPDMIRLVRDVSSSVILLQMI